MKKVLGLLIALLLSTEAFASLSVMPTRLEINANKLKNNYVSTAIEVKGDASEIMRYRVYPGYFTINDKGELVDMEGKTAPNDLSKKVRYVPSEFNVLPKKSQKVRINIVGIKALPDGENRCVLYIEDVNPKEYAVDTGKTGINAQLIVKSRIGVPIYVEKGKITKNCTIEDYKIDKIKDGYAVSAKLVSSGNTKVRYGTSVQIFNGKKLVKEEILEGGVVADNSTLNYRAKISTKDIPSGEYTMRFILLYKDNNGKQQSIKQEQQINI